MNIPPVIPIETFFRNPAVSQYSLSPNGKKYAFLSTKNSRLNIVLVDKENKTEEFITSVTERDVSYFVWVNSDVIVYFYDTGGDENYKAFACILATKTIIALTPFDGVVTSLVSRLYNDPKHILLSMNKENPQVFDVYKCNVETGDLSLVAKNPGNILSWICADDGTIKCAYVQLNPETEAICLWDNTDNSYTVLIEIPFPHSLNEAGISKDGNKIYLSTNLFSNYSCLYEFDIETKSFTSLYEHPSRDVFSYFLPIERKNLCIP